MRLEEGCTGEGVRKKVAGAIAVLGGMRKGGGLSEQLGWCLKMEDMHGLGPVGQVLVWGRDEEDSLKILHPREGGEPADLANIREWAAKGTQLLWDENHFFVLPDMGHGIDSQVQEIHEEVYAASQRDELFATQEMDFFGPAGVNPLGWGIGDRVEGERGPTPSDQGDQRTILLREVGERLAKPDPRKLKAMTFNVDGLTMDKQLMVCDLVAELGLDLVTLVDV